MRRLSIRFWLRALALAMGMLLAAALVLGLAGCGGAQNEASSVRLARHEGELAIQDGQQKELSPAADMALYSGYRLATGPAGYGWLTLDESRLAKLDESSKLALQKEGKALTLELESGSLFFNIEKPLAQDESLTIRSSEMTVGVRGTCGWAEADGAALSLYLLTGRVELSVPAKEGGALTKTLEAGQYAVLREDEGQIDIMGFLQEEVPAFVREELKGPLLEEAFSQLDDGGDGSGFGEAGQPGQEPGSGQDPAWADELLAGMPKSDGSTPGVVGSQWIDFTGEGEPVLLVIRREESSAPESILCCLDLYAEGGLQCGSLACNIEPGWPVELAQKDGMGYLAASTSFGSNGQRSYNIYGFIRESMGGWNWQPVEWFVVDDTGGYNAVAAHNPDGSVTYGNDTMIECSNAEARAVLDSYQTLGPIASNEGGQLVCAEG